jgi:TRAP transporter TAXI family solute receptor
MKKVLLSLLMIGILFSLISEATFAGQLPPILNVGTHPMGSLFNAVGTAVATVVAKYSPMKATVKPMSGPAAWYPLMVTGEIDLGVANSWDSEKGYLGESVYEKLSKGKGFPVRLIAVSTSITGGMVVAADSGIFKYPDLRGKRIAGNFPSASLQFQAEAYLANGGLTWADIKPVPVSSVIESAKAVVEGRADASGTSAVSSPAIEELHTRRALRFLPFDISPEALKRTKARYPGYPIKMMPGPGRSGVEKEQYLWAYDNYIVARQDLSDEAAYEVVKALWENYKELGLIHADLKNWVPERFVSKEAIVPFHPGAIKFYKEKGIWTDELLKLQESLLAKKK